MWWPCQQAKVSLCYYDFKTSPIYIYIFRNSHKVSRKRFSSLFWSYASKTTEVKNTSRPNSSFSVIQRQKIDQSESMPPPKKLAFPKHHFPTHANTRQAKFAVLLWFAAHDQDEDRFLLQVKAS